MALNTMENDMAIHSFIHLVYFMQLGLYQTEATKTNQEQTEQVHRHKQKEIMLQ